MLSVNNTDSPEALYAGIGTVAFYHRLNELDRPIQPLYCIAIVCVVWFSMEFFWRLLITADRKHFLCSAYGIIDLATIIPFYLEMILPYVFTGTAREFSRWLPFGSGLGLKVFG